MGLVSEVGEHDHRQDGQAPQLPHSTGGLGNLCPNIARLIIDANKSTPTTAGPNSIHGCKRGLYLISGVDEFGDYVVGGSYIEDLGIYLVISLGSFFNKVYEFELNGEELSGVYYQSDENGSRISNYYPLSGERVFEKARRPAPTEVEQALSLENPMPEARRGTYLALVRSLRGD